MKTWQYWEGKANSINSMCMGTVSKYSGTYELVTPESFQSICHDCTIMNLVSKLPLAIKSDLIRYWLLHNFGGIWVDSDVIMLREHDLHIQDKHDLIAIKNPANYRSVVATPIVCNPHTQLTKFMLDRCTRLCRRMLAGNHIPYGETSRGVLQKATSRFRGRTQLREHWKYCPVSWKMAKPTYCRKRKKHTIQVDLWRPSQIYHHLTNPVTSHYKNSSAKAILADRTLTSFLFSRAMETQWSFMGRTFEILKRLPHSEAVMLELGVWQGNNILSILPQRSHLTVYLVDTWGLQSQGEAARYKATGDYQAKLSPGQWEHVYQKVVAQCAFAGSRCHIIRSNIREASAHVQDGSLDLAFIDHDHSYGATVEAIDLLLPKIKPGGYIGGHDFRHPREGIRYGVSKGVREKFGSNVEVGRDYTWFVKIPR
ncbi:MAG: class I SAM-dependent methyltransferase [bacterium]